MKKSKQMCGGCEDNFYNGNNPYSVKECWSYKSAKIKSRKRVPINQVPPWKQPPEKLLSCYKKKGYVFVEGNREY
jgi:hypothetical protein